MPQQHAHYSMAPALLVAHVSVLSDPYPQAEVRQPDCELDLCGQQALERVQAIDDVNKDLVLGDVLDSVDYWMDVTGDVAQVLKGFFGRLHLVGQTLHAPCKVSVDILECLTA
jgi:hypothetical protein